MWYLIGGVFMIRNPTYVGGLFWGVPYVRKPPYDVLKALAGLGEASGVN